MKNRRVHFAFDERSLEGIGKLKEQGRHYVAWVPEPGESREMPRMFTDPNIPEDMEHWVATAPTWTSTLPTESGYYWCRLGKTKPFLVDWEYADGDPFAWDIEKEQEIPQVLLLEHEWWSERVKPPEEE